MLEYTDDEIKDEILPEISSTSAKGVKKEKLKLKRAIREERKRIKEKRLLETMEQMTMEETIEEKNPRGAFEKERVGS